MSKTRKRRHVTGDVTGAPPVAAALCCASLVSGLPAFGRHGCSVPRSRESGRLADMENRGWLSVTRQSNEGRTTIVFKLKTGK